MPPRRTPTIGTKLAPADLIKFETICRLEGKTKTEMARKAIREYIERHEQVMTDERESQLEARIHHMEDRLAGLMVKLGIGVYKLDHLFWTRTDKDIRADLFRECHAAGVKKMREKLTASEEEMRRSAKE